jgi:hypothetical protein
VFSRYEVIGRAKQKVGFITQGPHPSVIKSPLPWTYVTSGDLPTDFDWRSVGGRSCVTRTANQNLPRACGCCWAVASTGGSQCLAETGMRSGGQWKHCWSPPQGPFRTASRSGPTARCRISTWRPRCCWTALERRRVWGTATGATTSWPTRTSTTTGSLTRHAPLIRQDSAHSIVMPASCAYPLLARRQAVDYSTWAEIPCNQRMCRDCDVEGA